MRVRSLAARKGGAALAGVLVLQASGAWGQAQPAAAGAPAAASMPVMAILPPKRPAGLKPAEEVQEAAVAPAGAPPAPAASPAAPAPAAPASVAAPLSLQKPVATAAASAAVPAGPLNDRAVVERANAYFNGLTGLVGDFVQVGGDGRRLGGKLYLAKPGKLRFEYDAPSTLEVIADGTSVAVRDRKLATQDLYPIGQTPLKFLVRDRIDLSRDTKVTSVAASQDGIDLQVQDSSTLGGTSKITLTFDPQVETLLRWQIVDPQGFRTTVQLSNLDRSRRVDARMFTINYERMLSERGGQ